MIHQELISVYCAHGCIIGARAFLFSVLCKQEREERELIYGYITHVVFLFCCAVLLCLHRLLKTLILQFSLAAFSPNNLTHKLCLLLYV